ncbi:unnamed protein product [Heligmosomoides polygyrus]|uniref:TOG domain-containing protein n=1 Tax=Heligmosomoides polygyrus TaxID=6339 RepID=A0A183F7J3_HELPZ|nr:unnamed protein product [Heligmosomoides polygyrus]
MRFIDMAVSSGDSTMRKLCVELYSIRFGCDPQMTERLLTTLSSAISNRLLSEEERLAVLGLKSLGMSSLRVELCGLLFDLYSSALAFAKPGQHIPRNALLSILNEGLNDPKLRGAALGTIRSLCTNGRSAVLPLSYGREAGRLLSAIVECSAFLVKPEVLLAVQRKVCEEAVRNPVSPIYREILASFLSCNHELVPPPVQIARTVMSRCVVSDGLEHLRSLCDVITRPRVQMLARQEVLRRFAALGRAVTDDAVDDSESVNTMNGTTAQEYESFDKRISDIVNECKVKGDRVEEAAVSQPATSSLPSASDDAKRNEVKDKESGDTITSGNIEQRTKSSRKAGSGEAQEKETKRSERGPEPVAKKTKMVKKTEPDTKTEERTVLMEGGGSWTREGSIFYNSTDSPSGSPPGLWAWHDFGSCPATPTSSIDSSVCPCL